MSLKPVVLITGASKGLGLAATKILLTEFNANVVALSRSETVELTELKQYHPEALLITKGDVTDKAIVTHAVDSAVKTYGHLDALILNAGILTPLGKIEEVPLEGWKSHFDVNFFSLITAVQAALPYLRKSELGGRIVFVSSGSATKGTATMGPYNAGKAAMNSMCRTLGEEEPDVISVALRPGTVDTQMQTQIRELGVTDMAEKVHKYFMGLQTDQKLIKPEVSGYVMAALALNAPKSMSGQFVSYDSEDCAPFRR
ncbi:short-chain dehydrogenase [Fomitopsis serialis]|uniref:short-chain dehydrogenase n=1 Tax=Fomitopsis serialis TaxID=139415 RepID=UPI002007D875|nr:short-chain dehydrogenase [Neoantrodia serialis]KAH9938188.1 short-chain dehydrogenase [Neoantrodia serialis]